MRLLSRIVAIAVRFGSDLGVLFLFFFREGRCPSRFHVVLSAKEGIIALWGRIVGFVLRFARRNAVALVPVRAFVFVVLRRFKASHLGPFAGFLFHRREEYVSRRVKRRARVNAVARHQPL